MADPYLEDLERVFREGVRDLHEAASKLGIPYEAVCATFNNGLLKGYWTITLPDKRVRCSACNGNYEIHKDGMCYTCWYWGTFH